ncbi:transcription termination factor MTEF1, chloroplastic isoform X2 [Phoenix dactylifera]|uniref:Transcription termination factor MTEF1, chloroplastic isoform X2 n=1 Tax=Phoenix dactylifera TaxID=42345 RepID=A0A8B8J7Z0_PHODC|nr:transcription termination factor MTEF1, chloroplastic isoform X2 [Phoenix dactylifera]
MEEVFRFCSCSGLQLPSNPQFLPSQIPKIPTSSHNAPPRPRFPLPVRALRLSPKTPTPLPEKPPKPPTLPVLPSQPSSPFHEKLLYLDSLGIDLFAAVAAHPPVAAVPLADLRATVDLLLSIGLAAGDLRRVCGMCPEVLAAGPKALTPVLTFLLREAGVQGRDLRRVIHRRPRLLVSDVACRLRPTLYFLQMLGITAISRHTSLLSCSVEEKLLPRLDFLQRVGFSHRDSRVMVRRFPQLFCYSIKENLQPKIEFLASEMGRELRELKEFPHYFSFSLENRIKPRHRVCNEKGVFLPLPALLRPSDEQFDARLEVCASSGVVICGYNSL